MTDERTKFPAKATTAVLAVLAWLVCAPAALATTSLPSVKIGTAALIAPSAADAYYGAATASTNGLGATVRPPEIVAMARALKNSPDLIYEYVRNNIDVAWMYGLQKGALGALIDKSGTAFDQAMLMAELLRQAGYTARYQAGTITLTGAQFTAWTNIADARAACQLLSSGGIPAAVNGTSTANCAYGTGTAITQVQMAHVWVKVTIGGSDYVFDPSYKPFAWKPGIDLAAATALVPGQPLDQASGSGSGMDSGTTSGVGYVHNLNAENLNTKLANYTSSLLAYLAANNLQGAEIEDVVSGGTIAPYVSPAGGLRQATLPYTAAVAHEWTGNIPDQYRVTLRVAGTMEDVTAPTGTDQLFDQTFFVDEIYGRRLTVDNNFNSQEITALNDYRNLKVYLRLDGVALSTFTGVPNNDNNAPSHRRPGVVTLEVNHPYAAASDGSASTTGAYMDDSLVKTVRLVRPFSIVHGWGDTGPELLAKWSGERAHDGDAPLSLSTNCPGENCTPDYTAPLGDFLREKIAAAWLGQVNRATHLHAAIARAVPALHHALGVVYAEDVTTWRGVWPAGGPLPDFMTADSSTRLDIDSAISLTSRTADAAQRRAALLAVAASSAALEASVMAQMADLPDTASTTTRFEWGNRPPAAEDHYSAGPRRFLQFDSGNAASAPGLVRWEGSYTASTLPADVDVHDDGNPQHYAPLFLDALSDDIGAYAAAGYTVVASQESFLGPGQRGGYAQPLDPSHPNQGWSALSTKQRGGALVATRYDGNGDPLQIAHLVTADQGLSFKGGGGGIAPNQAALYDPAQAADVFKAHFADRSGTLGVNLSNGALSYTSPVGVSAGRGGLPHALSGSLVFHPGPLPDTLIGPLKAADLPGWKTSWDNQLAISGSGMEAMGASDIRAAAGTVAAFLATQDIYKASPTAQRDVAALLAQAWWVRTLRGNVVNVTLGGTARQFLRQSDGSFIAPGAGPRAQLVQSGARVIAQNVCPLSSSGPQYQLTRGWDDSGLSFALTGANGDVQHFAYWENVYIDPGTQHCAGHQTGFRLASWSFPQGVTLTLAYSATDHVASVSNSLGRRIDFVTAVSGTFPVTTLTLSDHAVPAHKLVAQMAYPWLDGLQASHTDALGAVTGFAYTSAVFAATATQRPVPYRQLAQVFTADSATLPNVQYDYDPLGRVTAVRDAVNLQVGGAGVAGGRDPWTFFLADGTRGERDDPLGGAYSVVYDTHGHPVRYIDELGRETAAAIDSRGRVVRYTYPEHDCERFAYDDANNTTDLWRVDKASSCDSAAGASHVLHVSATWDPAWNKPLTVVNARGVTTTFTYYAGGNGASLMATAVRPADGFGNGAATYGFTYSAAGLPLTATDPDGVATTNSYDGAGNLTAAALDPAHLNLVTQFAYDDAGDVTATTDPRGNVTTSLYDLDRRKIEDDRHNGNAAAAVIAATQTVYDVLGRVVDEKAGTAFSGTAVTTWLTTAHTTYTPTSKVATVTDADSRTVTTTYDALDRVDVVADPIGRKVHNAYDAAGQLLVEYRAWGDPLQIAYATHSYTPNGKEASVYDALGATHTTTYTYDGFDRLAVTTYPDASHEDLTYDAGGNILTRRNRAGQTLAYAYDLLDRMRLKTVPWAGSLPGHAAVTAYSLAGRVTGQSDSAGPGLSYAFDTAGRATAELQLSNGVSRTVTWTLDASSNRTRLAWPDGYAADYAYDALNRPTAVTEHTGGGALAAYAYDALGRRTSVSYNSGTSAMSYTYTDAGDLLTLTDDLAGTANDVTFTDTYTAAHQLASETTSNSAYSYTTAAAPTAYAAVNTLNQYTTVGGSALTWDANGNLATASTGSYTHDPENRMTRAIVPGTSDSNYTYDPLGRRVVKTISTSAAPLWGSATWNAFTWTAAATTATTYLHAGSSEIAEYDGAGTLVRRFVPGPSVDEFIAMVTSGGTKTFVHTNRQGSVIAMADTSGAPAEGPYTYDAYGNCFTSAGASCTTLASTTIPFRFTGQRYDAETNLYYYKARYYCVGIGRFCETDPVGYGPDINLYTAFGNDPTDRIDPTGNNPIAAGAAIGCALDAATGCVPGAVVGAIIGGIVTGLVIIGAEIVIQNEEAPSPDKPVSTPTGVTAHPDGTVTDAKGNSITGSEGGPGTGKVFPSESPEAKANNEGSNCTYCGKKTTDVPRTPDSRTNDHIVPRSRGGNNSPANRDPNVCQSCNSSKRNTPLWEWIRKKFGKNDFDRPNKSFG